jgi:hypothetical protein
MTQSDAARIAARLVVLYLPFWIVSDLTAIPREIVSFLYEWRSWTAGRPAHEVFFLQSAILFLTANILRIALWSCLALWFYQCGPRIHRFFGVAEQLESPKANDSVTKGVRTQ